MKGKMSTELGEVLIDEDVIAKYAGTTAVECFGIVGMAAVSMTDGLVKLLKKDSITKGIDVQIDEGNDITIDFHVIVSYGVNISSVADNLVSNVRYKVEEFTGLKVQKINIYVEGVRIID
ncbi:MAG: Asp23/Gls24 family envelope stress response protein [Clostridiales bacterium]|nr:Asp23/Gls24 family envelope stress response protein [Clostridiales bacterium]